MNRGFNAFYRRSFSAHLLTLDLRMNQIKVYEISNHCSRKSRRGWMSGAFQLQLIFSRRQRQFGQTKICSSKRYSLLESNIKKGVDWITEYGETFILSWSISKELAALGLFSISSSQRSKSNHGQDKGDISRHTQSGAIGIESNKKHGQ